MKYIILNRTISGLGGAEIYTRNKACFMEEQGYEVEIFSSQRGNIYIDYFKRYEDNIIGELNYNPNFFSKSKQEAILSFIETKIYDTNVIIESHSVELALWAELIRKRVKAKNFVFLLDDTFPRFTNEVYDYLLFKIRRKELACIDSGVMKLLLKEKYALVAPADYYLSAVCTNSIQPAAYDFEELIDFSEFDIKLFTISRIEKRSVNIICSQIVKFAVDNPGKRILYYIFGDTNNKSIKNQLISSFNKISNVTFFISGFIYPIPLDFIKKFDLCISVAGAARAASNERIPTMTLNQDTGKPFGIMGYNTKATQYEQDDQGLCQWKDICDGLNSIFINNEIDLSKIEIKTETIDYNQRFLLHIEFINSAARNYELYDISNIKSVNAKYLRFSKIFSLIIRIFGFNIFSLLYTTMRNVYMNKWKK